MLLKVISWIGDSEVRSLYHLIHSPCTGLYGIKIMRSWHLLQIRRVMRFISRVFAWTLEARGGQGCAVSGSWELSNVYVTGPSVLVGQMDQRECCPTGREWTPQVCLLFPQVAYYYRQREDPHLHSRHLTVKIQFEGSLRVHENRVSGERITSLVAPRAVLSLRQCPDICATICLQLPLFCFKQPFQFFALYQVCYG